VVAVELAQAFLRLGSKVTLIARSTQLSKTDRAIGDGLEAALEGEGMRVLTHTAVNQVRYGSRWFRKRVSIELDRGPSSAIACWSRRAGHRTPPAWGSTEWTSTPTRAVPSSSMTTCARAPTISMPPAIARPSRRSCTSPQQPAPVRRST
jgi:pyridine nucleotide-disulfide oxidoreductase